MAGNSMYDGQVRRGTPGAAQTPPPVNGDQDAMQIGSPGGEQVGQVKRGTPGASQTPPAKSGRPSLPQGQAQRGYQNANQSAPQARQVATYSRRISK